MEVDSKSRYYDLDKWFDKVIEQLWKKKDVANVSQKK
jgi:hypothetical protein